MSLVLTFFPSWKFSIVTWVCPFVHMDQNFSYFVLYQRFPTFFYKNSSSAYPTPMVRWLATHNLITTPRIIHENEVMNLVLKPWKVVALFLRCLCLNCSTSSSIASQLFLYFNMGLGLTLKCEKYFAQVRPSNKFSSTTKLFSLKLTKYHA